jgi:LmbE family N-acetylglucosaminyl deacetylase
VLRLALPSETDRPPRLLCLGAHADDIEIGSGGIVLRLLEERPDTIVRWVVFSGSGQRAIEARTAAAAFVNGNTGSRVEVLSFRDGYFPFQGAAIKDFFETLKRDFEPSLILTHRNDDAHQDHRLVSELTYQTFRDHLILEYEIPKYEGDLANPNVFVPLTRAQLARKIDIVTRCFASQRARGWFTEETFAGLARLRGVNCRAPDGVAEAFHVRKIVL